MTWGNNWSADNQNVPQSTETPAIDIPPHIKYRLDLAQLPCNKDGLLQLWQRDEAELKKYKDTEMELRKICAAWLVPVPEKKGINNVDLGNGWTAKVGIKINYKFDATNDEIQDAQEQIEKCGNEGPFLADRLVKWTATLSVTEYEKLLQDCKDMPNHEHLNKIKEIMQSIIVTDNGAPTLSIHAPKGKK